MKDNQPVYMVISFGEMKKAMKREKARRGGKVNDATCIIWYGEVVRGHAHNGEEQVSGIRAK